MKLKKTPTECFKLLKEVYGEDVMLRMQIFQWNKRFEKGCEEVENDPKTRQHSTRTDENITRVKQLVQSDCRLTVQMISDELSLNRESVQMILLHDLEMQSCVPNGAQDFIGRTKAEPSQILLRHAGENKRRFGYF